METRQGPEGKYAFSAKMGEKGQIVIPKEAREMFGLRPGDTLLILCDRERGIAIPAPVQTQAIYQQLFGEGSPKEGDQ